MYTTKVYNLITLCYALHEQSTHLQPPLQAHHDCWKLNSPVCLASPLNSPATFYRDLNETLFVLAFLSIANELFFSCCVEEIFTKSDLLHEAFESLSVTMFRFPATQILAQKADKHFPLLNKAN